MRIQVCLTLALGFALATHGCGDDDDGGSDTSSEVCCDCYQVGDTCPPEAEALWCEAMMPWCGGEVARGDGAWRCTDGVWTNHASGAGAPLADPAGCVALHGEGWTCTGGGECIEETGDEVCCDCYQGGDACPPEAEALNCPGTMMWCDGSIPWGGMGCEDGIWSELSTITGFPSPNSSPCQAANGPESYCAEDGSCEDGAPCQAADCCLPASEAGNDHCQSSIGSCSWCQYSDNWGHCYPLTCE